MADSLPDPVRAPLQALLAGVEAVRGDRAVEDALLSRHRGLLPEKAAVIALGKAAEAMVRGAVRAAEKIGFEKVGDPPFSSLFVVTRHGHLSADFPAAMGQRFSQVQCHEGGHPLPDVDSLAAGAALLEWCAALPPQQPVLVLLSGGASAVVEALHDPVTLTQWRALNDWLLGSGWPIEQMNRVRAQFSRIKGGGLARALGRRPITALVISDIPSDDFMLVGSGPLSPLPAPAPETWQQLPRPFCDMPLIEAPKPSAIPLYCVADNRRAREAAAAEMNGEAVVLDTPLIGDVERVAQRLLAVPQPVIAGGEPTVRLPDQPGRGGRAQHLALRMAQAIAGTESVFIALGTDGNDGPTPHAGAWVDGKTWARAEQAGLDPAGALAQADSGRVLAALGQTIDTGPTGTNVMDLFYFSPAAR
ncbi:glycerate kinase type-2 family protein [Sulfurivirga caldicuralii]|uniref:glycerate kinase type-2 family protein n=1 Tax=Sulfurivirga caldicuralii TaxID=364032 RepID=UPI0013567176|nr:DUF4147 domain-containing protein [Sulfurivirga caldicuralii]